MAQVAGSRKSRLAPPPYEPDGQRIFYTAGVGCNLDYLRALVQSDSLFADGLPGIRHWSEDRRYYKHVLTRNFQLAAVADQPLPPRAPNRLQPDCDLALLDGLDVPRDVMPGAMADGGSPNVPSPAGDQFGGDAADRHEVNS